MKFFGSRILISRIYTPVKADILNDLLIDSQYDEKKRLFLFNGFKRGFPLHYEGSKQVKVTSRNLPLHVGDHTDLWNKVMKEVQAKRFAGPYENIPYTNYIQSPIGLVPKDGGKKTRLIFHLSHPKGAGTSVNACIPEKYCSVRYPDFEQAVKMCKEAGKNCRAGKSDMSAAFRHVPLSPHVWKYLILKAEHPITKKLYYFVEKCLPFGSSISCSHFQAVSDAIAHIVKYRNGNKSTLNYLDDYFFAAFLLAECNRQIQGFLDVCNEIAFPVSLEKTQWGTTLIVFLGLLIDTVHQIICVPADKVERALEMVDYFLDKSNKKVTVLQIQKLCGFLNFLCRAIVPGRAFLMRLFAMMVGNV